MSTPLKVEAARSSSGIWLKVEGQISYDSSLTEPIVDEDGVITIDTNRDFFGGPNQYKDVKDVFVFDGDYSGSVKVRLFYGEPVEVPIP